MSVLIVSSLAGCSSTSTKLPGPFQDPFTYGYTKNDPCFRCGETWIFVHKDHEAQPF